MEIIKTPSDITLTKLLRVTVFIVLVTIQFFICNSQYKLYNNNIFLLENGTITTTNDYFMTGRDDDRFVGYWYYDEERKERVHGIESHYKSIMDELSKKYKNKIEIIYYNREDGRNTSRIYKSLQYQLKPLSILIQCLFMFILTFGGVVMLQIILWVKDSELNFNLIKDYFSWIGYYLYIDTLMGFNKNDKQ